MVLSVRVSSHPNTEDEESIRFYNLKATQCVKDKNYIEAIDLLRKSNKLMPKVRTEYPISQYLRLPVTLQKAGEIEGAITELMDLLLKRNNPFDKAAIHDKLRLVYQREKDNYKAIENAVVSLAWECLGYSAQERDISFFSEAAIWEKKLKSLMKKISKESSLQGVVCECINYSKAPEIRHIENLIRSINVQIYA